MGMGYCQFIRLLISSYFPQYEPNRRSMAPPWWNLGQRPAQSREACNNPYVHIHQSDEFDRWKPDLRICAHVRWREYSFLCRAWNEEACRTVERAHPGRGLLRFRQLRVVSFPCWE